MLSTNQLTDRDLIALAILLDLLRGSGLSHLVNAGPDGIAAVAHFAYLLADALIIARQHPAARTTP